MVTAAPTARKKTPQQLLDEEMAQRNAVPMPGQADRLMGGLASGQANAVATARNTQVPDVYMEKRVGPHKTRLGDAYPPATDPAQPRVGPRGTPMEDWRNPNIGYRDRGAPPQQPSPQPVNPAAQPWTGGANWSTFSAPASPAAPQGPTVRTVPFTPQEALDRGMVEDRKFRLDQQAFIANRDRMTPDERAAGAASLRGQHAMADFTTQSGQAPPSPRTPQQNATGSQSLDHTEVGILESQLRGLDPNSPEYQRVKSALDGVYSRTQGSPAAIIGGMASTGFGPTAQAVGQMYGQAQSASGYMERGAAATEDQGKSAARIAHQRELDRQIASERYAPQDFNKQTEIAGANNRAAIDQETANRAIAEQKQGTRRANVVGPGENQEFNQAWEQEQLNALKNRNTSESRQAEVNRLHEEAMVGQAKIQTQRDVLAKTYTFDKSVSDEMLKSLGDIGTAVLSTAHGPGVVSSGVWGGFASDDLKAAAIQSQRLEDSADTLERAYAEAPDAVAEMARTALSKLKEIPTNKHGYYHPGAELTEVNRRNAKTVADKLSLFKQRMERLSRRG